MAGQCANCKAPRPDGATECPQCSIVYAKFLDRQAKPQSNREYTPDMLKSNWKWMKPFGLAIFSVVWAITEYYQITEAERSGGTFRIPAIIGWIYHIAGKWGIVGVLLLFGCGFFYAGWRAMAASHGQHADSSESA